jgi:hypothetical protein
MRRLAVVLGVAILAAGTVRAGSVEVDFNPVEAPNRCNRAAAPDRLRGWRTRRTR